MRIQNSEIKIGLIFVCFVWAASLMAWDGLIQCRHFYGLDPSAIPSGALVGVDVGNSQFGADGKYECDVPQVDDAPRKYLFLGEVGDASLLQVLGPDGKILSSVSHGLEDTEDVTPTYLRWLPFVIPLKRLSPDGAPFRFRLIYRDIVPYQTGLRSGAPSVENKVGVVSRWIRSAPTLVFHIFQIFFLFATAVGFLIARDTPWRMRVTLSLAATFAAIVILQITAIPRTFLAPDSALRLNQSLQVIAVPAWVAAVLLFFGRQVFWRSISFCSLLAASVFAFAWLLLVPVESISRFFGLFMLVAMGGTAFVLGIRIASGQLPCILDSKPSLWFGTALIFLGLLLVPDIYNYLTLHGRHYYFTHFVFFPIVFVSLRRFHLKYRLRQSASIALDGTISSKAVAQASHDLQSPLSALISAARALRSVGSREAEVVQSVARRIRDIADSIPAATVSPSGICESIPIAYCLRTLLEEKHAEFPGLESRVRFEQSPLVDRIFVRFHRATFLRVISNLLNNAIEAVDANAGEISFFIRLHDDQVELELTDNGPGIPANILEALEAGHVRSTKRNRFGLGLVLAQENIREFGGTLTFESSKCGTKALIRLTQAEPPIWFERVSIVDVRGTPIVAREATKAGFRKKGINVSGSEGVGRTGFVELDDDDDLERAKALASTLTGVEKIVFVSREPFPELVDHCLKTGATILSRNLISTHMFVSGPSACVLIDDDELVSFSWKEAASSWGIAFKCFTSDAEALDFLRAAPRETIVFVDLHLGGKSGLKVCEKIAKLGYREIFLVTGEPASTWRTAILPNYLRGVRGKNPPWYP